ncbi:MAG: hypothetical protein HYS46_04825 [Betaproteobacteria bacterium]|nr:hypothetical protein [Betaproteobacteria bacterium]
MKRLLIAAAAIAAFAAQGVPAQAATPAFAAALGFDYARHLLNRTSYAASVENINAFARFTPLEVLKA